MTAFQSPPTNTILQPLRRPADLSPPKYLKPGRQNTGQPRYLNRRKRSILANRRAAIGRQKDTGLVAMNVLIVEDSEPMRRIIKSVIEDLADRIFECVDGREALAEFERYRPDWTLMDIKMKHIDGLAATRQIKAAFPDARIVMVTSYDEQSLRDEAQSAGACGYVLKENLRELMSILLGEMREERVL